MSASTLKSTSGTFVADLVTGPLTVKRFVDRATPGNVGICLSGGGSRALSAGMGQLRGLKALGLLEKTRAISTVSGGSWVGVTFEFLSGPTTDDDYLNEYVPDPGRLVRSSTPGHSPAETLDVLPRGNIGNSVASKLFSIPALAVEAFLLFKFLNVPPNFLWQALMGMHILKPYGLFEHGLRFSPTSLFSWDRETLTENVTRGGTQLQGETAHLVASGPGRVQRPYLLCNTSMFLAEPGTSFRLLAPVQSTPFCTGIVGAPSGTDANDRTPGGGGVTSFGFSSNPMAVAGSEVSVGQLRQWALADAVGASSAAFAETLGNLFAQWQLSPRDFFDKVDELFDDVLDWLKSDLDSALLDLIKGPARHLLKARLLSDVQRDLSFLTAIIPEYAYWPVAGVEPFPQTLPTQFADGGSLENTGVANMLTYTDIESVIAFVNSSQRMEEIPEGVVGPDGHVIPGTGVLVDGQIPPLFGYQPYQQGKGYRIYAGDENPTSPESRNSQVFPAQGFADLLKGLWQASGSGTARKPAVFTQSLAVQDNVWFGVTGGGRTVRVLWVYTDRVKDWYDALSREVQAMLGSFDDPESFHAFPHYSTFDTDLTATEVNLLASLTAWTVAADENRGAFEALYTG
ncbi:MAG: hypothetical protein L0H73_04025 [Nitrococcus sp.]|nr:hypothetical protein [Nitrococcus sp.]